MSDTLRFGPLEPGTVHLCIDMQRLFADGTPWHTPWLQRILPLVTLLSERAIERTIFTRFIPPRSPEKAHGAWQRYYRHWSSMTGESLDPALLSLVEPLGRMVPPALAIDKTTYSAFGSPELLPLLSHHGCRTLVISGGETDVCVLSTVLDAVDRGFRVVLPTDALCSSQDETHDALMAVYRGRFSHQIECTSVAEILEAWPR